MNFIKNQKVGVYAYILVLISALVTLQTYISNVNKPYYQDMKTDVVYILVGAIVATISAIGLAQFSDSKVIHVISDLCRIGATILFVWACVIFISMRLESFGYIFGSNLEMGNAAAFDAGNQAIRGIIFFAITWLLSVVASFLDVSKKVVKQVNK